METALTPLLAAALVSTHISESGPGAPGGSRDREPCYLRGEAGRSLPLTSHEKKKRNEKKSTAPSCFSTLDPRREVSSPYDRFSKVTPEEKSGQLQSQSRLARPESAGEPATQKVVPSSPTHPVSWWPAIHHFARHATQSKISSTLNAA